MTLTATVSPLLVGTAIAAREGSFHLVTFLATFFSCLFLQIGTNYFNEYFDYRYGLDHAGSLGAMTVIFRNEMTANQVLIGGIIPEACAFYMKSPPIEMDDLEALACLQQRWGASLAAM